MMHIITYDQCRKFLNDVEMFLLENEYMNNLMLGLLYRLKDKPSNVNDLFLRAYDENEEIVMMMSGLYIIIYANTTNEKAYEEIIKYINDKHIDYPGAIGPNQYSETFAKAYQNVHHQPLKLGMSQRIFVNSSVNQISDLDAQMISIEETSHPILLDWMYDFLLETLEKPTIDSAKERLNRIISEKSLYVLMHNHEMVSMAGAVRPFRNGISVGYVYTPPHHRNKGYTTNLVQQLTKKLLETYSYCTLYTDLANPTSNSIYQKIGYLKVGDSTVYIK